MCVLPFESHPVLPPKKNPQSGVRLPISPLFVGLSAVLLSGGPSPAHAQASAPHALVLSAAQAGKIAPAVRAGMKAGSETLHRVIVQTDGAVPPAARALLRPGTFGGFASLRRNARARGLVPINAFGTLAARLTGRDIALLAADPHTRHISPDLPIRASGLGGAYLDYALEATGLDFLQDHNSLSGSGVGVAVVDTGVYSHDDLAGSNSRLAGWKDLVNNNAAPYDDNGHGTHVAGLVASNGAVSSANGYGAWLRRAAPAAQIVGVKVLDQNGSGSVSTVIAGIDWCVAHRVDCNIRILNLSVGHPVGESYTTDPLCQACDRAWAAGITVVVAAGNYGRSVPSDASSATQWASITSPGNDPHVITVGAMNTRGTFSRMDDTICTYSSRGPSAGDLVLKPDIVAPGNRIISLAAPGSTLYAQCAGSLLNPADYGGTGSKGYLILSGTSMATPIVSGAVAVLLQADPTLTPDTIKARLMLSATKTAGMDYQSYGAGYLNVVGALLLTQVTATHTLSPSLKRNLDGTIAVTNFGWGGSIQGENFGWGDNGPIEKDKIKGENFGWGDNGPIEKDKLFVLADYETPHNFGWTDNRFNGMGVFGPQQLPPGVGTTDPAVWNGGITTLSSPDAADSLSLLLQGD